MYHVGHELGPYILGLWTALRWIIAALTSIAVIGLIYHHGVPRTQPWHRVLPGRVRWPLSCGSSQRFCSALYLRRFANYDVIYGSVATAIALLIWLYIVSMVVLIGAEFNALRYPRFLFGAHSEINRSRSSQRCEPLMTCMSAKPDDASQDDPLVAAQLTLRRRAKIVCTIGPASNTEEMIRDLMLRGMNVARLNFSHGTHEDHAVVIQRLRKVAAELSRTICILQDLQGPEDPHRTAEGSARLSRCRRGRRSPLRRKM